MQTIVVLKSVSAYVEWEAQAGSDKTMIDPAFWVFAGATSVTQSGQQLNSDAACSPLKTEPSKSLRPLTALPQQMSIEGVSAPSGMSLGTS